MGLHLLRREIRARAAIMDAPPDSAVGGTYVGNPRRAGGAGRHCPRRLRGRRPGRAGSDSRRPDQVADGVLAGAVRGDRGRSGPRDDARARVRAGSTQGLPRGTATAVIRSAARRVIYLHHHGGAYGRAAPRGIGIAGARPAGRNSTSGKTRCPAMAFLGDGDREVSFAVVGEVISGALRENRGAVGVGGMSNVYRARPAARANGCAQAPARPLLTRRGVRRAGSAQRVGLPRLSHPGIVTVIDRGEQDADPVHRLRARPG